MRYGLLIIPFVLCLAAMNLNGQQTHLSKKLDFTFRNIDYTNGLLGNNVSSILQDKKGFMWIGTLKGLQRYDGLRFVTYSNKPIGDIYPDDAHNKIFFETSEREVNQLDLLSNRVTKLEPVNALEKNAERFVDWRGKEWMISRNSLRNVSRDPGKISGYTFIKSPDDPQGYHASILRDSIRKETWINHSDYGLLLFDDKSHKIYSETYNGIQHPLLSKIKGKHIIPRHVMMDSHQNIWLYTWAWMFYRYNAITGEFRSYSVADIIAAQNNKGNQKGWVNSIFEDDHGNVWIATANAGLLEFDPVKDDFNYVLPEQKNSGSIQLNYEVYKIAQDKEENLWIATDKGISIFNPYRQNLSVLRHDENNPNSLPKSEINAVIMSKKSDLYIGTWGGGITIYDKQMQFRKNLHFSDAYEKNLVWCFIQNDDGTIWAGCQHGYLHIINPENLVVRTIRPPELENATIRCMEKDSRGNIWFGLHNGKIAKWDRALNAFLPFNKQKTIDSLMNSPVISLFIDQSDHFWISTPKEFRQFDPSNMSFIGDFRIPASPDRSAEINYHDAEQIDDSTLLVGTENAGLVSFNTISKTFASIPINENNTPYSAHAVKKDGAGYVWFTGDYDIYAYSPRTSKFAACNTAKGVITSSFPSSHFYITPTGKWYTWSFAEVISFYPDSINPQRVNKMPVTIAGFKVFDKPIQIDSLLYAGQPIRLSYKQNFLSIEYALLDYSGVQHTKYYYQLTGIDKDWVFAGTKAFANYTNLSPGEYLFRVKAENTGANDIVTSLRIIIATPFWQTKWFIMICLVAAIVIVYLVIRWRINSIRHEAELKHKIAETEMMALRSQMNPHFIFNCLNAIDNLIQTNQKGKATTYLNRFARLIRSVLDSSKNNLVSFHKDYETLKLFLELEQFRCSDNFQFSLNADAELLNSDIKVPPLIIQPFVENAIHHGLINKEEDDRKLNIDIKLEKEYIKYTIIDNGIGRKQAALLKAMNKPEHVPYGIEISRKRVELHNHNGIHESILITDLEKDNKAAGTKVEFWLSPQ